MPRYQNEHVLGIISRHLVLAATARPTVTLVLGGLIAVGAVWIGLHRIEIHTSRADLLNPRNEYHRRWLEYVKEFSDKEDVYVVVEGEDSARIRLVLDEMADSLAAHPEYFCSILHRVDKSRLRHKALYYIPTDRLRDLADQLPRAVWHICENAHLVDPVGFLVILARQLAQGTSPEMIRALSPQIASSLQVLRAALTGGVQFRNTPTETGDANAAAAVSALGAILPDGGCALAGVSRSSEEEMFFSPDGRIGLLLLRFTPDSGRQFTRFHEHIRLLRTIVSEVNRRHPETRIGVTGLPVLEYDEMKSSSSSGTLAGLSLLGVMLVFFAGFGGIRYPLAVSLSLATGVLWSVGYVALAVGHLNILTSAFGAMLIGLGDYGVHFTSHYLDCKRSIRETRTALMTTATSIGPGIATGAITTAAAFFAGAFTDFLGVAELGVIAGGGILFCWLADMTILPAILCIADGHSSDAVPASPVRLASWFRFLVVAPRAVTLGLGVATALFAMGLPRLRYDYNLLNLQPMGLDSVETQNKLVAHMSRSSYYALSIAPSLEEAKRRKGLFESLPTVDRVEDLVSVIPDDLSEKAPLVQAIVGSIRHLQPQLQDLQSVSAITGRELDQALARLEEVFSAQPDLVGVTAGLMAVRHLLGNVPPQDVEWRLMALRGSIQAQIPIPIGLMDEMALAPPNFTDLPAPLVERFVGRHGKHLLQIYCKGDFWNPEVMAQFVSDVRSVDPEATGNPIQIYEACHQMNRAYLEAAVYAFIAIVFALYLDFRNVRDVFLSTIPLFIGMVWLFGLMGWLDLPLNPANMITLPLILGIGIDNGVHIVHDFRRQGRSYRMPTDATLTAVVVNSLTTMVGFGALMLSSHRGLESLGRVLTFGVGFTLLTALLVPGFLRWVHGLLGHTTDKQEWVLCLRRILEQTPAEGETSAAQPPGPLIVPRRIPLELQTAGPPLEKQPPQEPSSEEIDVPDGTHPHIRRHAA